MSAMWAQLSALACATRPDLLDAVGRRLFDTEPCALPIVSPEDEIVTASTTTIAASITAALPLPLPEPYFFATIDAMTFFLSWLSLLTLLFGVLLALGTIVSRTQLSASPSPLPPQPTTITATCEPSDETESTPQSPLVAHALLRLALVSQMHPVEPVPEAEWRQVLSHPVLAPHTEQLLPPEYRRDANGERIFPGWIASAPSVPPLTVMPSAASEASAPDEADAELPELEAVTDTYGDEVDSHEYSSGPEDDASASEGSQQDSSPEPLCSDAESDDDEESIPEPADDFSYLDGDDVSGNNMPTLNANQYTLDDYPPEGKTYLSAWNLISQNSGASEMNASDDSETVYDPVPPPKSADEERNDEDRLDLGADDIHQPSAEALPDVLPKDRPEPSASPEPSPAAQEDTEPVIVACLPPSLASEVYASLTPAKSYTKGHYNLYHDAAVLMLAFWMGFDHAAETAFVPQAVVAQCSFLDTFPALAREEFENSVKAGMQFAECKIEGVLKIAYGRGLHAATQVVRNTVQAVRIDDLDVPYSEARHTYAYIAGWRVGIRSLCAKGPRTRESLDMDCFAYGLNGLRDGEVIAMDVLRSMNQTQLEDFLAATCYVIHNSTYRSKEKIEELGRRQALYGVDRRDERYKTIQKFTLEELGTFRDAYIFMMFPLIRSMRGNEHLGPFDAVVPKRFTVADFAKNYFAHAGSERCDAETCATRFKHMDLEEIGQFLEVVWDEIRDVWGGDSNVTVPDLADVLPLTLEEFEEYFDGSPKSSRASSPEPSDDESDMYDVCPLSPQPPLPLSLTASRSSSPAPTEAVVERAPTPAPSLPPPSPSPPPPPAPARSEKYLMGHAHAVEGFAHNPLGLTTRFFAARDWDAPTFDDYRRGWLAGMLELVARTAGAPHDGLGCPRAWCKGMGLPTWVDQDPKTPDELMGYIKKMTPSDIGEFLRKGWKKLGEKGRKNGRYDYAGPCDVDVVHFGEPTLDKKIAMALAC